MTALPNHFASRVVIIHGAFGSPEENWFPWLSLQLENFGAPTCTPRFPTPENQSLENWIAAWHAQAGGLHPRDILVGHSIGAAFALRVLEMSSIPARGVFLVSPFASHLGDPKFDSLNESFVGAPFDWEKIKKSAGHVGMYYGENDPYVPLNHAEFVARSLDTPLAIIESGGHLNAAAGFRRFPELLEAVSSLLHSRASD